MKNKVNILGVDIEKTTMENAYLEISDLLSSDYYKLHHIVTVNPEMILNAQSNRRFKVILNRSFKNVADGIGVVIGSKILKNALPERVAGIDLILNLLHFREEQQIPTKIYCLGSKEEVILKAVNEIRNQFNFVEVVGYSDGYFGKNSSKEKNIVEEISRKNVDLLLVGTGSPRQEEFIYNYRDILKVKVAIGVGGSFDVISGSVKRAPEIYQKLNLEWLYRLLKEPARFKRQLSIPLFLLELFKVRTKKEVE